MKKRGSAIVISMLLITAISVISFGIAKMIYAGSQTVQMYENGSVAYYSAESGMEEAFLRYRYNQNAQVPFRDWHIHDGAQYISVLSKTNENNFEPYSDTGGNFLGTNFRSSDDQNLQAYAMKMGYLGVVDKSTPVNDMVIGTGTSYGYGLPKKYGSSNSRNLSFNDFVDLTPAFVNENKNVFLQKDDAIKIDMSGYNFGRENNNQLVLMAKFFDTGAMIDTEDYCKSMLEVKFTVREQTGIVKEYTELVRPLEAAQVSSCDGYFQSVGISKDRTLPASENITVRPAGTLAFPFYPKLIFDYNKTNVPSTNDSVTLTVRTLFGRAAIGLIDSRCALGGQCDTLNSVVPGPETYITSMGYYGGIQKSLKAFIDRQSGSLYDLFDYVIYMPDPNS